MKPKADTQLGLFGAGEPAAKLPTRELEPTIYRGSHRVTITPRGELRVGKLSRTGANDALLADAEIKPAPLASLSNDAARIDFFMQGTVYLRRISEACGRIWWDVCRPIDLPPPANQRSEPCAEVTRFPRGHTGLRIGCSARHRAPRVRRFSRHSRSRSCCSCRR